MVCNHERPRGEEARDNLGLRDKMQRDNAGRERKMHTWLSLAGNFKVQGLNGWKKTSAVRQWMAKENREAKHMLGHNDPKQTNKNKKKEEKKRDTNEENMSTTKQWQRASANKQLKQCFLQAALCASVKSIAFVCWLCLHSMLLEREKKHNQLLSMAF